MAGFCTLLMKTLRKVYSAKAVLHTCSCEKTWQTRPLSGWPPRLPGCCACSAAHVAPVRSLSLTHLFMPGRQAVRFLLIQQQWVKFALEDKDKPWRKEKIFDEGERGSTVKCKSTLRGWTEQWTKDVLGTHRIVHSGTWTEVDLADFEYELPEGWQVRPRARTANRRLNAASPDIESNSVYFSAPSSFTEVEPC